MLPATEEHVHQKTLSRLVASAGADASHVAVLQPAGADGRIGIAINGLLVGSLGRGNSVTYAYLLADGPLEVAAHITRGRDGWLADVVLPRR